MDTPDCPGCGNPTNGPNLCGPCDDERTTSPCTQCPDGFGDYHADATGAVVPTTERGEWICEVCLEALRG